MPIWCPKCHYKTVLAHFPDERCPQCRSVVPRADELRKDPYQPEVGKKMGIKRHQAKKFQFDQKDGSDIEVGSGNLKSKPVDPTFGIKGRI